MNKLAVVVLGAGVSGMTSALLLSQAGYAVQIWAAELPQQTTSRIAAAFWYPFLVQPEKQAAVWGKLSYQRFDELTSVVGSGVILRPLRVLFREKTQRPAWAAYVRDYRPLEPNELPSGYRSGYSLTTSVIEMPLYLSYLQRQLFEKGIVVQQQLLKELPAETLAPQVFVNCTGLGSRELFRDANLFAVRGQVTRGNWKGRRDEPVSQITFCPETEEGPTYIVPRSTDVILGGTSEHSESLEPRADTTALIAARCQRLEPSLSELQIIEPLVGLRPARTEVRLEIEKRSSNLAIVHNYGHGGAGVTLSWGCAEEVVMLVQSL